MIKQDADPSDVFGVTANVKSDRVLRTGAKVWILLCNGDAEAPKVYGIAKGGRYVKKYTKFKRLENFRPAWMPKKIMDMASVSFDTKEKAAQYADSLNEIWSGVRYFNRDGTELVEDGKTPLEAIMTVKKSE